VPADATSLTELKRVSSVDSVVVVSLLLQRVGQPTLLVVRYEVDFGWKATELEIITLRRPPSPKRD
jgi:hypothetical protein